MLAFPCPAWDIKDTPAVLKKSSSLSQLKPFGRSASCIQPRLYLSDYATASDPTQLARLGITHILSALDFDPEFPEVVVVEREREGPTREGIIKEERRLQKMHVRIRDGSSECILDYFDESTAFIGNALREDNENKVLVHCLMGISRSTTLVCAYLIAEAGMTAPDAIEFVQSKRGIACPNLGFRRQLEEYETRVLGSRGGAGVGVGNSEQAGVKTEKLKGGCGCSRVGIAERIRTLNFKS